MLRGLDRLEQHGYAFGARRVVVLSTQSKQRLGQRLIEALDVACTQETLDHPYYSGGLRYQIWVTPQAELGTPAATSKPEPLPLIDGGAFNWLTKLVHNRRLVYVASGAGAQLMPLRFRAADARANETL
jgi:hypothetical protein